jgi:two-component system response regulator
MSAHRTILLAEDDPNDVEMTKRAMKSARLANELVVVSDGVEALQYLRRQGPWAHRGGGLPGVLLLDIKMPRKNGLEVLRDIRADPVLKVLPVVMLTSSRENPDLEAAYSLGANAYVVKPVDFTRFVEAVSQIGAFWAVVNEPPGAERPRLRDAASGPGKLFEVR